MWKSCACGQLQHLVRGCRATATRRSGCAAPTRVTYSRGRCACAVSAPSPPGRARRRRAAPAAGACRARARRAYSTAQPGSSTSTASPARSSVRRDDVERVRGADGGDDLRRRRRRRRWSASRGASARAQPRVAGRVAVLQRQSARAAGRWSRAQRARRAAAGRATRPASVPRPGGGLRAGRLEHAADQRGGVDRQRRAAARRPRGAVGGRAAAASRLAHEEAALRPRLDQALRQQLVVGGDHGARADAVAARALAHRRQPRAGRAAGAGGCARRSAPASCSVSVVSARRDRVAAARRRSARSRRRGVPVRRAVQSGRAVCQSVLVAVLVVAPRLQTIRHDRRRHRRPPPRDPGPRARRARRRHLRADAADDAAGRRHGRRDPQLPPLFVAAGRAALRRPAGRALPAARRARRGRARAQLAALAVVARSAPWSAFRCSSRSRCAMSTRCMPRCHRRAAAGHRGRRGAGCCASGRRPASGSAPLLGCALVLGFAAWQGGGALVARRRLLLLAGGQRRDRLRRRRAAVAARCRAEQRDLLGAGAQRCRSRCRPRCWLVAGAAGERRRPGAASPTSRCSRCGSASSPGTAAWPSAARCA